MNFNRSQISDRSLLAYVIQQRLSMPSGRIKKGKDDNQLTQMIDRQIEIAKNTKNKAAPQAFKFLIEAGFPDMKDKNAPLQTIGDALTDNEVLESAAVELVLVEV